MKDAVYVLSLLIDDEDKTAFKNMSEEEFIINIHFSIGLYIRNNFGLWSNNKKLLRACGGEHINSDDAATIILKAFWKNIQST
jgi:hypothetical protein